MSSLGALDDRPEPDNGDAGPYVLIAIMRAKPELADEFEQRMLRQIDPTRREVGNIAYNLHRDKSDRNAFYFYEAYADAVAFQTHLDSEYITEFVKDLPAYLASDLEMIYLSPSSKL
jgi:quinol monooxygenase YgiN